MGSYGRLGSGGQMNSIRGEPMHRALVVEDQDLMRLALMAELTANLSDCYIAGAQTFELAVELLAKEDFDIVIIDPGLPGFDPTSASDRLKVVQDIVVASPRAMHMVVTGSDTKSEAQACRALGAAAYLGKTGLSRGALRDILEGVSSEKFSLRYSKASAKLPDVKFPRLTPREDQIIGMMMRRQHGAKRRAIFESMAERFGIDAASAEKYYKQARAKLLKLGQLPKGL